MRLILDHREPFLKDCEDTVFCSSRIRPHLPSHIVNKGDEIRRSAERLMWHRATNVRMDQIERARFSRHTGRMCGSNLIAVLAMLAELMIREGQLGNVTGLR
jgi:hypothetical protein